MGAMFLYIFMIAVWEQNYKIEDHVMCIKKLTHYKKNVRKYDAHKNLQFEYKKYLLSFSKFQLYGVDWKLDKQDHYIKVWSSVSEKKSKPEERRQNICPTLKYRRKPWINTELHQ